MNVLYLMLSLLVECTAGQSYQDYGNLFAHLFNESRYDKEIRPMIDQSKVIRVNVTMGISNLDSFDLATGEIFCELFFVISWKDELLTWNPLEYGNISGFTLPKGKTWRPNLVVFSQDSNTESNLLESDFSLTYAFNTGEVLAIPTGTYRTLCDMNTTYYPFDTHTCTFRITVENHVATELLINSPLNTVLLEAYNGHSEWEILPAWSKAYAESLKQLPLSALTLENAVYIKRKPLSEIFTTVIPLWLLNCLGIATHFVRPASGERLSYVITVYLSFVFATTAFIGTLPRNSDSLTLANGFTFTLSLLNTLNVLWSIFIVWLAGIPKEDLERVPKWLNAIARDSQCSRKIGTSKDLNSVHPFNHDYEKPDESQSTLKDNVRSDENNSLTQNCIDANDGISNESIRKEDEAHPISGENMAKTLDRYYFNLSLFLNVAFLIVLVTIFFAGGIIKDFT